MIVFHDVPSELAYGRNRSSSAHQGPWADPLSAVGSWKKPVSDGSAYPVITYSLIRTDAVPPQTVLGYDQPDDDLLFDKLANPVALHFEFDYGGKTYIVWRGRDLLEGPVLVAFRHHPLGRRPERPKLATHVDKCVPRGFADRTLCSRASSVLGWRVGPRGHQPQQHERHRDGHLSECRYVQGVHEQLSGATQRDLGARSERWHDGDHRVLGGVVMTVKRVVYVLVALLCVASLSSCSFFFPDYDQQTDVQMQHIADAVKHHDAAALKKLFSPRAREKATDLDGGLTYFLSAFPSGSVKWTNQGAGMGGAGGRGKKAIEIYGNYEVDGGGKKCDLYFAYISANDFHPDEVGMYAIGIEPAETGDYSPSAPRSPFNTWASQFKIDEHTHSALGDPGFYVPQT